MQSLKIIYYLLVIIFLTVLTQVGGIAYIVYLILKSRFKSAKYNKRWFRYGLFLVCYSIISFIITPVLAKQFFNRKPLPISYEHLRPLRAYTFLLNRHYVAVPLYDVLLEKAETMGKAYPNVKTYYLDANFPLIAKFPLLPHLSHNDGRKVDLTFYYKDANTNMNIAGNPSVFGYGFGEEATGNEQNTADFCSRKGYWQYSILQYVMPKFGADNYVFDAQKTKKLVELLVNDKRIGKLFIEPHLKSRMQLSHPKIRFHGCQAVRHDDHIHVQL